MEQLKEGMWFVVCATTQHKAQILGVTRYGDFYEVMGSDGRIWIFHRHLKRPDKFVQPWTYQRLDDTNIMLNTDYMESQCHKFYVKKAPSLFRKGLNKWYSQCDGVVAGPFNSINEAAWSHIAQVACCETGFCKKAPLDPPSYLR